MTSSCTVIELLIGATLVSEFLKIHLRLGSTIKAISINFDKAGLSEIARFLTGWMHWLSNF